MARFIKIGNLGIAEDQISDWDLAYPDPQQQTHVRFYIKDKEDIFIDLAPGLESDAFRFYIETMGAQTGVFDVLKFYEQKDQVIKMLEKQKEEAKAAFERMHEGGQIGSPPSVPPNNPQFVPAKGPRQVVTIDKREPPDVG